MKHLFSGLVALLTSLPALSQTRSPGTGLPVTPPPAPAPSSGIPYRPANLLVQFDSVRRLQEINVGAAADAYPWLSADGLRLYYQTDETTNTRTIRIASRSALGQSFSPAEPVAGLPTSSDQAGIWLSEDELQIWYAHYGARLFHSRRNSLADPFGLPTPVVLNGLVNASIFGPSLTASEDELFLGQADSVGTQTLVRYTRTAPDVYTLAGPVTLPASFMLGPGQLTADGLHLTFCATVFGGSANHLYQLSRPTVGVPFGSPQTISLPTMSQGYSESQSSYRPDLHLLAFVTFQSSWTESDLWLTENLHGPLALTPAFQRPTLSLTPNPAHHTVRLTGLPPGASTAHVIDALGRTVQTSDLAPLTSDLSLQGLPPGLYTVRVGAATRRLVVE